MTICVNRRLESFGKIEKDIMVLNGQGKVAEQFWREIPSHYLGIGLDVFVVMPNHLHGIVVINERPANGGPYRAPSLSVIISSYKNVTSKTIHKTENEDFEWQHSFYDHVIRSDEELNKIREYILNNPKQWEMDENNIKTTLLNPRLKL